MVNNKNPVVSQQVSAPAEFQQQKGYATLTTSNNIKKDTYADGRTQYTTLLPDVQGQAMIKGPNGQDELMLIGQPNMNLLNSEQWKPSADSTLKPTAGSDNTKIVKSVDNNDGTSTVTLTTDVNKTVTAYQVNAPMDTTRNDAYSPFAGKVVTFERDVSYGNIAVLEKADGTHSYTSILPCTGPVSDGSGQTTITSYCATGSAAETAALDTKFGK